MILKAAMEKALAQMKIGLDPDSEEDPFTDTEEENYQENEDPIGTLV